METTATESPTVAAITPASSSLIPTEALSIILTTTVAIVMVGVGCGVEWEKLKEHLKKPTGIIVGIVCQYVVMPGFAFALAKIFQMSDLQTLALLLVGFAPGGTTSNVVTYFVNGDMDLSVSMTAISSALGFGTMPLLLWIYQFGFPFALRVPFDTIAITLASLLIPIAIGMVIRYKFPKQASIILKVLSVLGVLAIVVVAVLSLVSYSGTLRLSPAQIICAALFPGVGMALGYGLSSLTSLCEPLRLHHYQRRTISIETGVQNTQLVVTIIQLSGFTVLETGEIILFPVIYLASQLVWIALMIISYRLYLCKKPSRVGHAEVEAIDEGKDYKSTVHIVEYSNEAYVTNGA